MLNLLCGSEKEAFAKDIPEPPVQQAETVYYFQEFYVQPMRLNLSFMRTPRVNATESEEETSRSPIRYVFDVFTMTIGNVNVSTPAEYICANWIFNSFSFFRMHLSSLMHSLQKICA